ncbi:MAG: hypothetical protein HQK55_09115 [Deltaproteobacteria bacterium]|nr:hypothetical protein [Deltaproteobacteria bacterium]
MKSPDSETKLNTLLIKIQEEVNEEMKYAVGSQRNPKETSTVAHSSLPDNGFNADLVVEPPSGRIESSALFNLLVKITNLSSTAWPALGLDDGTYCICLSYHWLRLDGRMFIFDGLRTSLPYDMSPGAEILLDAVIKAPYMSGNYILEVDMLQEGVTWFGAKGSKTPRTTITIEPIIL